MTKKFVIALLAVALLMTGALAGGLLLHNVYAQSPTPTAEVTETEEKPAVGEMIIPDDVDDDLPPFRRGGVLGIGGNDDLVAEKLGVSAEDIAAARIAALEKALDDAVGAGVITQAQADSIKTDGVFGWGQLARFAGEEYAGTIDQDKYLAESLGVTLEALEKARAEVRADCVAAAVKDGLMTQEEADLMSALEALGGNKSFMAGVLTSLEEHIAKAVSDGLITQAQADALLAHLQNQNRFSNHFGFDDGDRGGSKFGWPGNGFMGGVEDFVPELNGFGKGGQPGGMTGGRGMRGGMRIGNGLRDGSCIGALP